VVGVVGAGAVGGEGEVEVEVGVGIEVEVEVDVDVRVEGAVGGDGGCDRIAVVAEGNGAGGGTLGGGLACSGSTVSARMRAVAFASARHVSAPSERSPVHAPACVVSATSQRPVARRDTTARAVTALRDVLPALPKMRATSASTASPLGHVDGATHSSLTGTGSAARALPGTFAPAKATSTPARAALRGRILPFTRIGGLAARSVA
jgi:hypothetical protein